MVKEAMEDDRRKGHRFPAQGTGHLTVDSAPAPAKQSKIVDVSRTGLQIELDEPLAVGSSIRLRLRGVIVSGEVGNCRLNAEGRYSLGISITEVADA